MMIPLLSTAIILFVAHVILIFTSFGKRGYQPLKYFWSHATLWLAGILISIIFWKYSGTGAYPLTDAFDTPFKKALPVMVALGLSLIAHAIVRLLVLPRHSGNQKDYR